MLELTVRLGGRLVYVTLSVDLVLEQFCWRHVGVFVVVYDDVYAGILGWCFGVYGMNLLWFWSMMTVLDEIIRVVFDFDFISLVSVVTL